MNIDFLIIGVVFIFMLMYKRRVVDMICLLMLLSSYFVGNVSIGNLGFNACILVVLIVYAIANLFVLNVKDMIIVCIEFCVYLCIILYDISLNIAFNSTVFWLISLVLGIIFIDKNAIVRLPFFILGSAILTYVVGIKQMNYIYLFGVDFVLGGVICVTLLIGLREGIKYYRSMASVCKTKIS